MLGLLVGVQVPCAPPQKPSCVGLLVGVGIGVLVCIRVLVGNGVIVGIRVLVGAQVPCVPRQRCCVGVFVGIGMLVGSGVGVGRRVLVGNGVLVRALLQCAWSAVRQGADPELKERFARLAAHWAQTSDRRGGSEAGDQGARALAPPPGVQRASVGGGDVAARAVRRQRLKRELEIDSLCGPSWSTPAPPRAWTSQSLPGVDHGEALAAATNNNLVGVAPAHTNGRMARCSR